MMGISSSKEYLYFTVALVWMFESRLISTPSLRLITCRWVNHDLLSDPTMQVLEDPV